MNIHFDIADLIQRLNITRRAHLEIDDEFHYERMGYARLYLGNDLLFQDTNIERFAVILHGWVAGMRWGIFAKRKHGETLKEIVYIGDEYYWRSGTLMSSYYLVVGDNRYQRTDVGKISQMLANGDTVQMRLATTREFLFFDEKLAKLEEDNATR